MSTNTFLYALQQDQRDVKLACDLVIQFLNDVIKRNEDDRAFYELFHELVYRIFGFEGRKCWLREATRYPSSSTSGSGVSTASMSPSRLVRRIVNDVVGGSSSDDTYAASGASRSFNPLWQSLSHLLSPEGPLFRVMYNSLAMVYEFPVSRLPVCQCNALQCVCVIF